MSASDDEDPKTPDLSPAPTQNDGGTRVDLGEDLLEKTAVLSIPGVKPPLAAPSRGTDAPVVHPHFGFRQAELPPDVDQMAIGPIAHEQIEDQMHSARILMGEGILEDAKRILRRIILTDSSLVEARKMLEEIHEIELKQIFGESDNPRRRFKRTEPITPIEITADIVMRGLDRDLKLGLFGEDGDETRDLQLSLFKDRAAMDEFGAQMDRDFAGAPPAERIDLGVAFLEMGLHDLAVRHFQSALQTLQLADLDSGNHPSSDAGSDTDTDSAESIAPPTLAATSLLAYALILAGRAFEATIQLQPLLNDADIDRIYKLDLVYIMGRAYEALGKMPEARSWYVQVHEIEPHYRDVDERLRKVPGV